MLIHRGTTAIRFFPLAWVKEESTFRNPRDIASVVFASGNNEKVKPAQLVNIRTPVVDGEAGLKANPDGTQPTAAEVIIIGNTSGTRVDKDNKGPVRPTYKSNITNLSGRAGCFGRICDFESVMITEKHLWALKKQTIVNSKFFKAGPNVDFCNCLSEQFDQKTERNTEYKRA